MIKIDSLSFSYGDSPVLHDISLEFPDHQVTGIIGPNGCGKSTLLAHLSRRIPSERKISLDGRFIETYDRRTYAQKVAALSQLRDAMVDDFFVRDIVLMGRYPYRDRFGNYSDNDKSIADSMIRHTGLSTYRDREMRYLSGGERQRVYIAKTFAQDTDVILLDEPTNHLDVKYKVRLMQDLKSLGRTVVLVIHDLELAAQYCDHVVMMDHGRVLETGTPQEVMTPDRLYDLFDVRFQSLLDERGYHIFY